MSANGRDGSAPLLAYLRKQLFQLIILILLDDEFVYAYTHGVIIVCGDGVTRRIFPRIFTYSADYPEK